jgi:hypothetical protein
MHPLGTPLNLSKKEWGKFSHGSCVIARAASSSPHLKGDKRRFDFWVFMVEPLAISEIRWVPSNISPEYAATTGWYSVPRFSDSKRYEDLPPPKPLPAKPPIAELNEARRLKNANQRLSPAQLQILADDRTLRIHDSQKAKLRAQQQAVKDRSLKQYHGTTIAGVEISASLQKRLDSPSSNERYHAKKTLEHVVNKTREFNQRPLNRRERRKIKQALEKVVAHGGDAGAIDTKSIFEAVRKALSSVHAFLGKDYVDISFKLTRFILDIYVTVNAFIAAADGRVSYSFAGITALSLGLSFVTTGDSLVALYSPAEDGPETVVAQGGRETVMHEGIIGSVLSWFSNLMVGSNEELLADEARQKRITSIASMFKSLADIAKNVVDFFFRIFCIVYEWIFGVPYIAASTLAQLNQLTTVVNHFNTDLLQVSQVVASFAADPTAARQRDEWEDEYQELTGLLAPSAAESTIVGRAVTNAEKRHKLWDASVYSVTAVAKAARKRRRPCAVCFMGPPGVGKTLLTTAFMSPYTAANKYVREETKNSFWNGYDPLVHKVFVIDDLFQETDPKLRSEQAKLLDLVASDEACKLDQPDLEHKGKVYFDSDLIIASTNERNWSNLQVVAHDALARRFDRFVIVVPRPEHTNSKHSPSDPESLLTKVSWKHTQEEYFTPKGVPVPGTNLVGLGLTFSDLYIFHVCEFNVRTKIWEVNRTETWSEIARVKDRLNRPEFQPDLSAVAHGDYEFKILSGAYAAQNKVMPDVVRRAALAINRNDPNSLFTLEDVEAMDAEYPTAPDDSQTIIDEWMSGANIFANLILRQDTNAQEALAVFAIENSSEPRFRIARELLEAHLSCERTWFESVKYTVGREFDSAKASLSEKLALFRRAAEKAPEVVTVISHGI